MNYQKGPGHIITVEDPGAKNNHIFYTESIKNGPLLMHSRVLRELYIRVNLGVGYMQQHGHHIDKGYSHLEQENLLESEKLQTKPW